jgi:hypothetical protein
MTSLTSLTTIPELKDCGPRLVRGNAAALCPLLAFLVMVSARFSLG